MQNFDNNGISRLAQEIELSIATKKRVLRDGMSRIHEITLIVRTALENGHKLLLFGNGGSAADSQHIAAEFVSKFNMERNALPAIALTTDTSILTAIANDYDFKFVFARQIEALGQPGDVALGISTSGNSPNVIKGVETAKEKGLTTVGFTGQNGGKLKHAVDYCFRVPSDSTPRIQEVHITVAHAICGVIEKELCSEAVTTSL
ncbi:MAG: D-sedoheptulose 7-phosphate isomerase [bacterium]